MPFQKGQSGNPAGRPRGSRNRPGARVQSLLEGKAEDVARLRQKLSMSVWPRSKVWQQITPSCSLRQLTQPSAEKSL